jgi:hypothetical protein
LNTEAEGFDLTNDIRFARADPRSNSVLGSHRDDQLSEVSAARRSNLNKSFTRDIDRTTATSLGRRDPFYSEAFKRSILEKASVRTPYSNIGNQKSIYGGHNTAVKNWYDIKHFNSSSYASGSQYGTRGRPGKNDIDIYSMFSHKSKQDLC